MSEEKYCPDCGEELEKIAEGVFECHSCWVTFDLEEQEAQGWDLK